jgi:hypothetical protein
MPSRRADVSNHFKAVFANGPDKRNKPQAQRRFGMANEQIAAVMDAVRKDKALAKAFTSDPKGYLAKQGIDLSKMKIETVPGRQRLDDSQLEAVAGGTQVCSSTGIEVYCVSVGDDI